MPPMCAQCSALYHQCATTWSMPPMSTTWSMLHHSRTARTARLPSAQHLSASCGKGRMEVPGFLIFARQTVAAGVGISTSCWRAIQGQLVAASAASSMADELSGGDVPGVLQCLQGALSSSPEVQKQAETVLVSLERRPGFCSCLAEVIGCKDYDHSARWLASVQLKNSISRHWRGSVFSAAEKSHIRSKLSSLVAEDDNQIAVQVALVYAKVARMDWPRDWPALFSQLLGSSAGPAAAAPGNRRVWLVLHHVLKELSSKRLAVSAQLLPVVWSQWAADTQALLAGLPSAAPAGPAPPPHHQPLLLSFERWLLLLKPPGWPGCPWAVQVLRRLILFGCVSDAKSLQPVEAVSVCIPPMVQALQQLVALRPALQAAANGGVGGAAAAGGRSAAGGAGSKQLAAMLDRSLLKLAKTQCQVQQTHPWSYHAAGALLPMMGFCCDQ
ncbi:armadillo-type protein, partial [Haematococcus lacustris]